MASFSFPIGGEGHIEHGAGSENRLDLDKKQRRFPLKTLASLANSRCAIGVLRR